MMILEISKNIYSKDSIDKAVKAYEQLADMSINENDEYWIIGFDSCKYDESVTIKEFENYLIGVENI